MSAPFMLQRREGKSIDERFHRRYHWKTGAPSRTLWRTAHRPVRCDGRCTVECAGGLLGRWHIERPGKVDATVERRKGNRTADEGDHIICMRLLYRIRPSWVESGGVGGVRWDETWRGWERWEGWGGTRPGGGLVSRIMDWYGTDAVHARAARFDRSIETEADRRNAPSLRKLIEETLPPSGSWSKKRSPSLRKLIEDTLPLIFPRSVVLMHQ